MACVPGALDRLREWAPQFPGSIGAHLQLTDGRPCSEPAKVPSLVDRTGAFPGRRSIPSRFNPREVALEWRAQIDALRGAGLHLTHIDSHHHLHWHSELFDIYVEIAREYRLSARTFQGVASERLRLAGIRSADYCAAGFYSDEPSMESLLSVIVEAKGQTPEGGLIELVSHPGHACEELKLRSVYVRQRERELKVLTDAGLIPNLAELAVELVEIE